MGQKGTNYATIARLEKELQAKLAQLESLSQENARLRDREHALQLVIESLGSLATAGADGPSCCAAGSSQNNELGDADASTSYIEGMLHQLSVQPGKVKKLNSMTLPERLAFLKQHICQMALLLPKIDCQHYLAFGTGNPEQQLQAVVDAVAEFSLASFWDDARVRHGNLMMSLDTMQPERYPPGHYMGLALAMNLTSEQQNTLKASWNSAKALKAGYESEYDQVAQQLVQLQQQQLEHQQVFLHAADMLPATQRPHWWCDETRRQQQSRSQSEQSSQQQQQQHLQQQQQEQSQQQQQQQQQLQPECGLVSPADSACTSDVGTTTYLSVPAACPTASLISSMPLVSSIPLVASSEQQQLEQRLDKIARQLKVLFQMQSMMLYNTLTAKQIATGYVLSWPFLPDSFSAMEAFEHLHGWNE